MNSTVDGPLGRHVLVTGGAGYIGSFLVGRLLRRGDWVTVIDSLLFGGESLLAHWGEPRFHFVRADVCRPDALKDAVRQASDRGAPPPSAVVHLAAIAGFPACEVAGREAAWQVNVHGTRRVFEAAETLAIERLVFASTYSNYGQAPNGRPVTEDSPLKPQSLYAETKVAAEDVLLGQTNGSRCVPVVFRFATLFGVSPRMRFDLIVNQFVLEALQRGELRIYQRQHSRSFVHLRDLAVGVILGLDAPADLVRRQVYNLGGEANNLTKDEVAGLVREAVPQTRLLYEECTRPGDMRDIRVSFAKVRQRLGFEAKVTVREGIGEILGLLR